MSEISTLSTKKGRSYTPLPLVPKVQASRGGPKAWSLGKNLRYVPIRCHFLHFEIIVKGNAVPKIISGSWWDAERVKMAERPQRNSKEAC